MRSNTIQKSLVINYVAVLFAVGISLLAYPLCDGSPASFIGLLLVTWAGFRLVSVAGMYVLYKQGLLNDPLGRVEKPERIFTRHWRYLGLIVLLFTPVCMYLPYAMVGEGRYYDFLLFAWLMSAFVMAADGLLKWMADKGWLLKEKDRKQQHPPALSKPRRSD